MAKKVQQKVDKHTLVQENDIVILVTGLLGSGKSEFINTLLGKSERMPVGKTLSSGTTKIDYEIIAGVPGHDLHGRRLVIVDTPGLDNRLVNDNKILRDIVDWVETCRVKEIAGVIYLYDIFQERHASISKVELAALRASFQGSKDVFERVILVTTKWNKLKPGISEGEQREEELKATFWKELIEHGSRVKRFEDSCSSAWEIVNALLVHSPVDNDFDVRSQLAKLRTNLDAKKKGDTSKDRFSAVLQSIFGMFSWGVADKIYGSAK